MQFHLNGYRPGDPAVTPAPEQAMAGLSARPEGRLPDEPGDTLPAGLAGTPPAEPDGRLPSEPEGRLPAEVDVLIVGCGPAGLTLAAQLAQFPGIATRIIDLKPGPLLVGQADGIACRTMEMFHAFGFSGRVLREAYWVNETAFWKPGADGTGLVRGGRIQDTEDGLSEFPHVILNQARIHDFFLDTMRHAPARLVPDYALGFAGLDVQDDPAASHPVTVRLERLDDARKGQVETLRARYVVGCDGARSGVRRAIGQALHGESANQAWGVMDVLAVTDFPDIRLKAAIHSAAEGSVLIIPREGGYLVRMYIELDKLGAAERIADRGMTVERLIAAAGRILHPYTLEVKEVAWWSVYEIGQRLCDRFDDVPAGDVPAGDAPAGGVRLPRVFIAGDACHTHSPKAGQGMNVSMQDGFNLGWKLAAVLEGRSPPGLLHTYSAERQAVAAELIAFDREFAAMFSAAPKRAGGGDGDAGIDPAEFQRYFVKQGRFTAGTATCYGPSVITAAPAHQALARGFTVGMRFHSAPVIRLADAKPVQLGHVLAADGRWRAVLFADAGDPADPAGRLAAACAALEGLAGRLAPAGADIDAVLDVRAVLQQGHRALAIDALPALLRPRKGRFGLVDYEKAFCPDPRAGDVFDARGVDRAGCIVVVRPDGHVATVLPLDGHAGLAGFFDGFMT